MDIILGPTVSDLELLAAGGGDSSLVQLLHSDQLFDLYVVQPAAFHDVDDSSIELLLCRQMKHRHTSVISFRYRKQLVRINCVRIEDVVRCKDLIEQRLQFSDCSVALFKLVNADGSCCLARHALGFSSRLDMIVRDVLDAGKLRGRESSWYYSLDNLT